MDTAVLSLIIFAVCIVLYISDLLSMAVVSILGCMAMVVMGVCSFGEAFSEFASNAVFLTIGSMIIGGTIIDSGLAHRAGSLVKRFTAHGEILIFTTVYIIAAVLSAFLNNMTVMAMLIPIIYGICLDNDEIDSRNIMMPLLFGATMGGICTLVGSTQQLVTQGLLEQGGFTTFKVFDFTPMGCIVLFIGYLYIVFIGYPHGKKLWGDREKHTNSKNILEKEHKPAHDSKPFKGKCIIIFSILCLMIILYVTEWIPPAATAVLCALLCVMTGCIKQEAAVKHINWDVIGRIGGSFGLAKALEVGGGTQLLGDLFRHISGESLTPFMLFIILCFIAMVMSEFMSNSVAILLVLPIAISAAPQMGLNVTAYAFGITFAASFGMTCPLSGSAHVMIMDEGYHFKDFFRYGLVLDIICLIAVIIFVPLLMPLTV